MWNSQPRRECSTCGRALEPPYTWRNIICLPCRLLCFPSNPGQTIVLRCKLCQVEVLISDNTVPDMVRRYKAYHDFSWQFPQLQESFRKSEKKFKKLDEKTKGGEGSRRITLQFDNYDSCRETDEPTEKTTTNGYRELQKDFSTSTQMSYYTANENFENASTNSFRSAPDREYSIRKERTDEIVKNADDYGSANAKGGKSHTKNYSNSTTATATTMVANDAEEMEPPTCEESQKRANFQIEGSPS